MTPFTYTTSDDKQTTYGVGLKCDCACSMAMIEKTRWSDGDLDFSISIQDSRYDHHSTTLWARLKNAFSLLRGKTVYYSDVVLNEDDFKKWVWRLVELSEE